MTAARFVLTVAAAALVLTGAAATGDVPPYVSAAISNPGRPAEDVARDAARKPAAMIVFAGIKPGSAVLELLPGAGYFTRIFSKVIGPTGHLYAAVSPPPGPGLKPAVAALTAAYPNVTVVRTDQMADAGMVPLDAIWTSLDYHDMHLSDAHVDVVATGRMWRALLKPGGVLVIVDHAALPGAPVTATADTLHRIDPAAVKAEMVAAGFVFDGESKALANPGDRHTALVFDPAIRGRTDQFVLRFRKPG